MNKAIYCFTRDGNLGRSVYFNSKCLILFFEWLEYPSLQLQEKIQYPLVFTRTVHVGYCLLVNPITYRISIETVACERGSQFDTLMELLINEGELSLCIMCSAIHSFGYFYIASSTQRHTGLHRWYSVGVSTPKRYIQRREKGLQADKERLDQLRLDGLMYLGYF